MKKYQRLFGMLVLLLIMTSCSDYTNYEKDSPFMIVSSSSNSAEKFGEYYPVTYSVYEDGTVVLSTEPLKERGKKVDAEDPPTYETHVSEDEIKEIKSLIEKSNFWKLPKDISVESEDGGYIYITVHLTNTSKKVGGLNPSDEDFIHIKQYVSSIVDSTDFKTWDTQVKDYLIRNKR